MAPASVAQWQLYRHFDAAGKLLYVGISHNALTRLVDHKRKASWFHRIRRIDIQHFAHRKEAFAAEAEAIKRENPQHNRVSVNALVDDDLFQSVGDKTKVHHARAKNSAPIITQERLKEVLFYIPSVGRFLWTRAAGRGRAETLAGNVCPRGYWRMIIDGRAYRAHQLAWLYVYGEWTPLIDHINGCKVDNRISNLRKATAAQNAMNSGVARNNTSGFRGVRPGSQGGWKAVITMNRRSRIIGTFETPEEASAAYEQAARAMHGEFVRPADSSRANAQDNSIAICKPLHPRK